MRFQLRPGIGLDQLLDLPWGRPVAAWSRSDLPVHDADGREDAVVVEADGILVEVVELDAGDAERHASALRRLAAEGVPCRAVVGTVSARGGARDLPAALLTIVDPDERTLDAVAGTTADADAVLDAVVALLVQAHVAGFVWGDPSPARMRFRRDAGALGAAIVDVGPGQMVAGDEADADGDAAVPVADARRAADLDAAAAALVSALGELGVADADEAGRAHALRHDVRHRYRLVWGELTGDQRIAGAGDASRHDRLRRVNELGFDVTEIEVTDDGEGLRLGAATLEPGHHRRRLRRLTRLVAQENQARRLLADLDSFRRSLSIDAGDDEEAEAIAAARWFAEVFTPTVEAVPASLRGPGLDDAEVFHEVLEHRWLLSERAGHDVGTAAAVDAYVADVLTPVRHPSRSIG